MVAPRRLDPDNDPFRPPTVPTVVQCIHCGQQFDSHLIQWREGLDGSGELQGFWCCPTPGCDGMGFGFDILPTDPEYRDERGGWVSFDDDDENGDDQDDNGETEPE
jgi:hypothetical protein